MFYLVGIDFNINIDKKWYLDEIFDWFTFNWIFLGFLGYLEPLVYN